MLVDDKAGGEKDEDREPLDAAPDSNTGGIADDEEDPYSSLLDVEEGSHVLPPAVVFVTVAAAGTGLGGWKRGNTGRDMMSGVVQTARMELLVLQLLCVVVWIRLKAGLGEGGEKG